MHFYKRNYIEGLFLSSAVEKSADYTMERLLETVIKLRKMYQFNGYIHLKGIPHADRLLIQRAGNYADRMSFNVELPSEQSLKLLGAPKERGEHLLPHENAGERDTRAERPHGALPAVFSPRRADHADDRGRLARRRTGRFSSSPNGFTACPG